MPPRAAISNFIMTMVILFFMFIIALLLKGRMRLPSEQKAAEAARHPSPDHVPKAIPVGQKVAEPRAYKSGSFWVLPHPEFVDSRSNDADTLRIKSGPKEDVFVLYGIDALQALWTRPARVGEQASFFGGATPSRILEQGDQALAWVRKLLSSHKFIVYTQFTQVPQTERYYAFVRVDIDGKQQDLGELLVRRGFATPVGMPPDAMPEAGVKPDDYKRILQKMVTLAKSERAGAWAK